MRVTATVILKSKDGRFLLQHRENKKTIVAPNKWTFFGGGVEKNDRSNKRAAAREMKEELELNIKDKDLKFIRLLKRKNPHNNYFLYLKPIEIKKLKLHEGQGMGLFTRRQIIWMRGIYSETRWFMITHNPK